ncbi:Uncharacterised protein [Burkholderia pseudomallei]|nr:Uncharacterised protein [Burkholderia pseudomallei]
MQSLSSPCKVKLFGYGNKAAQVSKLHRALDDFD